MPANHTRQALALLLLGSVTAWSQTLPNAGSVLQQLDRDRAAVLPMTAPPPPMAPTAPHSNTDFTVTVQTFAFAGNTLLSAAQLQQAVQPYRNRPLNFDQLQAATQAVSEAYREAGWIVRAYLPEQDFAVSGGTVTIQVLEARLGRLQSQGDPGIRVAIAQLEALFDSHLAAGQLLRADQLDRALLLADDLPGVSVAASLRAGAQSGETDVVLHLSPEPLVRGNVGVDNTGSRSTGAERLVAGLGLASPLGLGDAWDTQFIHTEGSDYLRLQASLPAGRNGLRLGAAVSALDYHLVAPEFVPLRAKGWAHTAGLEAVYPLLRARAHNLYLSANLDRKEYDNQSSAITTSRYHTDMLRLGLSGNRYDTFGGGGVSNLALDLGFGYLDLGGSPNQASDASGPQTAGAFNRLNFQLNRLQTLSPTLSFNAALSGQWADKNLDSSERLYLGGADGVRAFPTNEAGGASGHLLHLELRWSPQARFTLTAFGDYGQVTVNRNNAFAGAATPNTYSLDGAGLSAAWQGAGGPVRPSVKATWSRRLNSNPAAIANGHDQDGSLDHDRLWIVANLQF